MGISYVNSYSFNGHMLCPFILIAVGNNQSRRVFYHTKVNYQVNIFKRLKHEKLLSVSIKQIFCSKERVHPF